MHWLLKPCASSPLQGLHQWTSNLCAECRAARTTENLVKKTAAMPETREPFYNLINCVNLSVLLYLESFGNDISDDIFRKKHKLADEFCLQELCSPETLLQHDRIGHIFKPRQSDGENSDEQT